MAVFAMMKKPELQDFGITPEEYDHSLEMRRKSSEGSWLNTFFVAVRDYLVGSPPSQAKEGPTAIRIKQYEGALATYFDAGMSVKRVEREIVITLQAVEHARREAEKAELRKSIDHWRSLRGEEFEQELAALYRSLGYQVWTTSKTGDDGIDLILTKEGKTTVVQCKGQEGHAEQVKVRELSGSRDLFKRKRDLTPHETVLACTGGFTSGAKNTAELLNITLICAKGIAEMAKGLNLTKRPQPDQLLLRPPVPQSPIGSKCPTCGSEMTEHQDRLGKFLRCSRFPKCKAAINLPQSGDIGTSSPPKLF